MVLHASARLTQKLEQTISEHYINHEPLTTKIKNRTYCDITSQQEQQEQRAKNKAWSKLYSLPEYPVSPK